jgi:hypothetical protein
MRTALAGIFEAAAVTRISLNMKSQYSGKMSEPLVGPK